MSEAISPQEAQLLFAPVEAILMVVDQPVTSEELGRVLNLSPEDLESRARRGAVTMASNSDVLAVDGVSILPHAGSRWCRSLLLGLDNLNCLKQH